MILLNFLPNNSHKVFNMIVIVWDGYVSHRQFCE
jgi:hypothetical protein